MNDKKYKYALIDMSYLLYRNLFAVSAGKKVGEYNSGDVIRLTIQTLSKLSKDWGITAEKYIMIYDKWDSSFGGYYTTYLLGGAYKDSRGDIESEKGKASPIDTYMTREKFEALKNDPNITPEELQKAEEKLYQNEVKYKAKWAMIRDLHKFGVPCIGLEGWEYDNLAWLSSNILFKVDEKPSVLVTKDSDLQYALTPKMDYFRLPTKGSDPEVITYDKMCDTIPPILKGRVSLYKYKAYVDALGDGHNGMRKTKESGKDTDTVISNILEGNFDGVTDKDLFQLQLSTFDISKFPRVEEAKRIVREMFCTTGGLGDLLEFKEFCRKNQVEGISDSYYIRFISGFNQELYHG